jgi:hypothetical protein
MPRKSTKPKVEEVSPDDLKLAEDDYAGAEEDLDMEPAYQASENTLAGAIRKRTKRPKNVDQPKRPLNAFMLYSADKRVEMKDRGPKLGVTEVAKAIGEQWRHEDADVKRGYQIKADELKEAYLQAEYRKLPSIVEK